MTAFFQLSDGEAEAVIAAIDTLLIQAREDLSTARGLTERGARASVIADLDSAEQKIRRAAGLEVSR